MWAASAGDVRPQLRAGTRGTARRHKRRWHGCGWVRPWAHSARISSAMARLMRSAPRLPPKESMHGPVSRRPAALPGSGTVRKEDLLPHRTAGDNGFPAAFQMSRGLRHCQEYLIGGLGNEPGGHAGIGIGFMGDRPESHPGCLPQDRSADIAAGAHYNIWLKLAQNPAGSCRPPAQAASGTGGCTADIGPGEPRWNPLMLNRSKVVARLL